MTLCDAVNDFRGKVSPGSRGTRYCSFAPPEETAGFIDLSAQGDGSRGIAFLTDRMVIRLGTDAQQIYYRSVRVTEILPSYETPFEDELVISSPNGSIRISDCGLNKFFLRQLINTVCRMSANMKDSDREELEAQLTAEALSYYSGSPLNSTGVPQRTENAPKPQTEISPVSVAAVAAVQEIAAAKKAAKAEIPSSSIEITEEKIQWLSGRHDPVPTEPVSLDDMTHEQTMSYLLDSIAEINSQPEQSGVSQTAAVLLTAEQPVPVTSVPVPEVREVPRTAEPDKPFAAPPEIMPKLTKEPDSPDIYIKASRKIRELCESGRLTMEQVDSAVKEQLVQASEVYSALDVSSAQLPPPVKEHAMNLASAADHLSDYFALGEDIAARVMFFMLYQMLSYTDRIVQSDETKQRLNYFFVRFGAAGIVLSMFDANN